MYGQSYMREMLELVVQANGPVKSEVKLGPDASTHDCFSGLEVQPRDCNDFVRADLCVPWDLNPASHLPEHAPIE